MFGAEGLLNEEVIPLELHLGVYVRVLHVTTSSKEYIQPRNGEMQENKSNGQTCESLALSFFIQRPLQYMKKMRLSRDIFADICRFLDKRLE